MIRVDNPDAVFLNRAGKYRAVVAELKDAHARNQPVLVGTTSIEVSEMLGEQLNEAGIHHEVLNAKQHEREATIIAQAGPPGAVTKHGRASWRERGVQHWETPADAVT